MKNRYIVLLLLLLVFSAVSNAKDRTTEQKKAIAIDALKHVSSKANRVKAMQEAEMRELKVMDGLTVMGFEAGGFAVVSNDDAHKPVVGVSFSEFDENDMPDGFMWWLQAVSEVLSAPVLTAPAAELAPSVLGYPSAVEPLMSTRWDQEAPYNLLCPESESGKTLTGCVATAMAQVLNYYKYPAAGEGWVSSSVGNVNLQLGEAYDWDNMLDVYNPDSYSEAEADAVSTLMYHCGLSVNMMYGTASEGGSGAFNYNVARALRKNFKYNKNVSACYRGIHTDKQWMELVYEELSHKRPIVYGAQDSSRGGHCFVLHGYDAEGKVYVNWGWSGSGDGYYDISLLNPQGYKFSESQDMIVGIAMPDENIRHNTELGCLTDCMTAEITTTPKGGKNVKVSISDYIYNFSDYDFAGTVNIILSGNDVFKASMAVVNAAKETVKPYYGKMPTPSFVSNVHELADGEYTIYAGIKETGYDTYQQMSFPEGATSYFTLVKNGDDVTLTNGSGMVTGIDKIVVENVENKLFDDNRIYNLNGVSVGTDINSLPSGVYIQNGRKFVK